MAVLRCVDGFTPVVAPGGAADEYVGFTVAVAEGAGFSVLRVEVPHPAEAVDAGFTLVLMDVRHDNHRFRRARAL